MTNFSDVPCAYAPLQPRDDGFWQRDVPGATLPSIDEGSPVQSNGDPLIRAFSAVLNAIKDLPVEQQKRVLTAATILVGVER